MLEDVVFADPQNDLDFITPGIGTDPWGTDKCAVIWSEVRWCGNHGCYTDTGNGRTWEDVYRGWTNKSNVTTILTVTQDDVDSYGLPARRIALNGANNIRFRVNGWNSTKSPDYSPLQD